MPKITTTHTRSIVMFLVIFSFICVSVVYAKGDADFDAPSPSYDAPDGSKGNESYGGGGGKSYDAPDGSKGNESYGGGGGQSGGGNPSAGGNEGNTSGPGGGANSGGGFGSGGDGQSGGGNSNADPDKESPGPGSTRGGDSNPGASSPASQARDSMDKAAAAVTSFFGDIVSAAAKTFGPTVSSLVDATRTIMGVLGVPVPPPVTYTNLTEVAKLAAQQQKQEQDKIQARIDDAHKPNTQVSAPQNIREYVTSVNKAKEIGAKASLSDEHIRALIAADQLGVNIKDISVISALGLASKHSSITDIVTTLDAMQKDNKNAVNEAANKIGLGIPGCAGGGCTTDQKNAQALQGLAGVKTDEYNKAFTQQSFQLSALEKLGYVTNELIGVTSAQAGELTTPDSVKEEWSNLVDKIKNFDNLNAYIHVSFEGLTDDQMTAVQAEFDKAEEDMETDGLAEATRNSLVDSLSSVLGPETFMDKVSLSINDDSGKKVDIDSLSIQSVPVEITVSESKAAPSQSDTKTQPTQSQNPNLAQDDSSRNTQPATPASPSAPSAPATPGGSSAPTAPSAPGAPRSADIAVQKNGEVTAERGNPSLTVEKQTITSRVVAGVDKVKEAASTVVEKVTGVDLGKVTRGIRNNNPGNIGKGADFVGEVKSDDARFAKFETAELGLRAMNILQQTYEKKYGLTTIAGRIARWSPKEENDTQKYIETVAKKMGIPATKSFSIKDPVLGPLFVEAIVTFENGKNPYSTSQIQAGHTLAFGTDEGDITTASTKTNNEATDDSDEAQALREADARGIALEKAFDTYGDSREAVNSVQKAVAEDIAFQLNQRCSTCENVKVEYSSLKQAYDIGFTDTAIDIVGPLGLYKNRSQEVDFDALPVEAQAKYVASTVGTYTVRQEIVAGRALESYSNSFATNSESPQVTTASTNNGGSIEDTAQYWSKDTFDAVIDNLSKGSETQTTGAIATTGYVNPITGTMDFGNTSQYGENTRTGKTGAKTRDHAGVDLYAETPSGRLTGPEAVVKAAIGGTVVRSQWQNGYGNTIDILGDDGKISRYAHTSGKNPNGSKVTVGQRYETGQDLTTITGSGTAFDAMANKLGSPEAAEKYFNEHGWSVNKPHVHFEIRDKSDFGFRGTIDPTTVLPDLEKGKAFAAGENGESDITTASTKDETNTDALVQTLKDLRDEKFSKSEKVEKEDTPAKPDSTVPALQKTDDRTTKISSVMRTIRDTVRTRVESLWTSFKDIFKSGQKPTGTFTKLPSATEKLSTTTTQTNTRRTDGKHVFGDIETISVHFGLGIGCPDADGVARNGYIYTLKLTNEEASTERTGCGLNTPYVYATEIADDLEQHKNFAPLTADELLKKMTFTFYNNTGE